MVSGKTKIVGLLGWPVEHTLSPAIQNAAFGAAGLDFVYVAFPVRPEELPQAIAGAKALGLAGLNVTVPHKVNIMPFLDGIDRSARLVGAVNTVVFEADRAIGYNTDLDGFINSLMAEDVAIADKRAILLGAGGAARAIVCGLQDNGILSVTVGTRDASRAQAFAATFGQDRAVYGLGWRESEFVEALGDCDILVQCTPVGMYPYASEAVLLDWEKLKSQAVVCDLIYNPPVTQFLRQAAAAGHKTVGGAGMLVEQGAAAFTLWTGIPAPKATMYQVMTEALAAERL